MPKWIRSSVTELQPWHMFIKAMPRGQQGSGKRVIMGLLTIWPDFLWWMPVSHSNVQATSDICATKHKFGLMSNKQTWKWDLPGKTFRLPSFSLMPAVWALHIPAADHTFLWGFQLTYLVFRVTRWGEWVVTSCVQSWAVCYLLCDPVQENVSQINGAILSVPQRPSASVECIREKPFNIWFTAGRSW